MGPPQEAASKGAWTEHFYLSLNTLQFSTCRSSTLRCLFVLLWGKQLCQVDYLWFLLSQIESSSVYTKSRTLRRVNYPCSASTTLAWWTLTPCRDMVKEIPESCAFKWVLLIHEITCPKVPPWREALLLSQWRDILGVTFSADCPRTSLLNLGTPQHGWRFESLNSIGLVSCIDARRLLQILKPVGCGVIKVALLRDE